MFSFAFPRPLAFYCLTEAISLATGAGMLAMGYRRSTALCGMTYYSFSGRACDGSGHF